MKHPRISIVTPSFNQGKYLEQTILSILEQKYPNLEYIIIDGGSTDNSVEIIKKYEKQLSYWVSEKDKGQSDALSKGLKKVTGDLFNWINSDDLLEEGALSALSEAYRLNPDKKVFCFGLNYLEGNKRSKFKMQNDPEDKIQCFTDPVISQPATFYSTEVVKKIGGVNTLLHYSMDYEWWLKFMFLYGNEHIFSSKEIIAAFRTHPEAKTSQGHDNFVNDMATMLYSLALKTGLEDLAKILLRAFAINEKYEFVLSGEKFNTGIVERMVVCFLLKWRSSIYTKEDFLVAKVILNKINFQKYELSAKELHWLNVLKKSSRASSWVEFRAKRKLRHLLK